MRYWSNVTKDAHQRSYGHKIFTAPSPSALANLPKPPTSGLKLFEGQVDWPKKLDISALTPY